MNRLFSPDTPVPPSSVEHGGARPWKSPYQDPRFNEAARLAGFWTDSIDDVYFFGREQGTLTAWEVDSATEIPDQLPDDYGVFQRTASEDVSDAPSYSTIALTPDTPRFSPRFMRNIRKAEQSMDDAAFHELTCTADIEIATASFHNPERRDDLEPSQFKSLILNLADTGLLRCFVLDSPIRPGYEGVSLVLANEEQANLRFYTTERGVQNSGHLLQLRVINQLFNDGLNIVDQSGYTPNTADPKLAGINEFKHQIGGDIITFTDQPRQ